MKIIKNFIAEKSAESRGNNMAPIYINKKWYINLANDEDGYTLLVNPVNELEPISFKEYEEVVSYISKIR